MSPHVFSESSVFMGLGHIKYWELSLDTDNFFCTKPGLIQSDQSKWLRGVSWAPHTAYRTDKMDIK